jgi:hypothetical protein
MPEDERSIDCTQRAYFYLARDVDAGGPPYSADELEQMAFDPDEVTRMVGLRPTTARRRGDDHPGRPEPYRFSSWQYELAPVRTYCTEDVVTRLLDAIEPHSAAVAEASAALGLRAGIQVVIKMSGDRDTEDGSVHVSTAAITYSAATVKRLARLNASVDHDQYIFLPD